MKRMIKHFSLVVLCLFLIVLFTACSKRPVINSTLPSESLTNELSTPGDTSASALPSSSSEITTPSNSTSESTSETSEPEQSTTLPTPEPTPTNTPAPEPTPTNTPTPTTAPSPVSTATPVPTSAAPSHSPDGRSGGQLNTPYVKNGVILLNKQHWVNRDYAPLPASENKWSLQTDAWNAWKRMEAGATAAGLTLRFVSGYRTFDYQEWLFNDYASRDPQGANRYSARPGQSEHQSGLALDIDNGSVGLIASFADTAEGQWLWANAWKYGWILRYPQGKEHITGYIFEPWHYRYVGEKIAADFGPNNVLTLEEYLDELPAKYQ